MEARPVPDFAYATPQRRVVFSRGTGERIGEELERLGAKRALLVTTAGRLSAAPQVPDGMGSALAGVFAGARAHVPLSALRAAVEEAGRAGADVCVAFGGGSAIGVAKGIALETGMPILAVPTTYAGSEMTSVWGITEGGGKRTGRDPRVAPRTVVYDPDLTRDFRGKTGAASGMNAIAHAVEALYAKDASPVSTLFAEEAIRRLAAALPAASAPDGEDASARADALLGAHLAGTALDMASMGLHHKLCHVLGGRHDLPHALVHAVLLPYVAAYNAPAAPAAMAAVSGALGRGGRPAPRALFDLNRRLGLRDTLRDLGLDSGDFEAAARAAVERSYPNPAPVTVGEIRRILGAASRGDPPENR